MVVIILGMSIHNKEINRKPDLSSSALLSSKSFMVPLFFF